MCSHGVFMQIITSQDIPEQYPYNFAVELSPRLRGGDICLGFVTRNGPGLSNFETMDLRRTIRLGRDVYHFYTGCLILLGVFPESAFSQVEPYIIKTYLVSLETDDRSRLARGQTSIVNKYLKVIREPVAECDQWDLKEPINISRPCIRCGILTDNLDVDLENLDLVLEAGIGPAIQIKYNTELRLEIDWCGIQLSQMIQGYDGVLNLGPCKLSSFDSIEIQGPGLHLTIIS